MRRLAREDPDVAGLSHEDLIALVKRQAGIIRALTEPPPIIKGFSISELRVLKALHAARGRLSQEAFREAVYYDRIDGGPTTNVLHVWFWKVKQKLIERGIKVRRLRGFGLVIDDASLEKFDRLMSEAQGQENEY